MSNRLLFMGCGAAPGVPAIAKGWGECDSYNSKNRRSRTGNYLEIGGASLLIDTSPDIRAQLLEHSFIRRLDGVLYTHGHADHLHGIDELRELNRIARQSLDIYLSEAMLGIVKQRFDYVLATPEAPNIVSKAPSLVPHVVRPGETFAVKGVEIEPLKLLGHNLPSIGYAFNGGELVYIADFVKLAPGAVKFLDAIKIRPKLMVLPLTSMRPQKYHADLAQVLEYVERFKPERAIINHMSVECDYDHINSLTPDNVSPAYDGMEVEF